MNQRLKRWESPRNEGRNDKGKGGSARQRQKRKQFQMLRKKLKSQQKGDSTSAISFFITCLITYNCQLLLVEQNLHHRLHENQSRQK
jgi:hypothetical protein